MSAGFSNVMWLIELLLDALSIPGPSNDERTRRFERIGCFLGLAVLSIAMLIVAVDFMIAR